SLATADPHGPGLHATLVRGGLPGLPDISTPIVIQAGAKSLIARAPILPCGNNEATAFRIFNVMATGALTLDGVTLRNGCISRAGAAGGAVDVEGGSLTLTNNRIEKSMARGGDAPPAGGNGSPAFGV